MNIIEYANTKLNNYKNLGWDIYQLYSSDSKVTFKSKYKEGILRQHTYSDDLIEVININSIDIVEEVKPIIKKTKRTKKASNE